MIAAAVMPESMNLDEWLHELRRQQFTFAYTPNRREPDLIAAYRVWDADGLADVVILVNEGLAIGYRSLLLASADPLAPDFVVWRCAHQPEPTIHAVLTLPAPGAEGAPALPSAVPDGLSQLTERFERYRTIRPPT